jgi:hypothetical protein
VIGFQDCSDDTFFELSTSGVNYKIREVPRKQEVSSELRKAAAPRYGPDFSGLLPSGNAQEIAGPRPLTI